MVQEAADVLANAVDGLQHLAGGRGSQPHDAWNRTCLQLLGLLNDYPGGVSTPVLETHLWAHRKQAAAVACVYMCLARCVTDSASTMRLRLCFHAQAGRHRKASSTTLMQLLNAADEELPPATLLHVHVEGVLDGGGSSGSIDTTAAAAGDPVASRPPASAVPVLLLRDASLLQGDKSVQQIVHSALRGVFSGPNARLGAGTQTIAPLATLLSPLHSAALKRLS